MSKSILVIDTPKYCIDCPCHFSKESGIVFCGVEKKELFANDIESFKPDWCPLRKIPERKLERLEFKEINEHDMEVHVSGESQYAMGWNACLDEILKGSE